MHMRKKRSTRGGSISLSLHREQPTFPKLRCVRGWWGERKKNTDKAVGLDHLPHPMFKLICGASGVIPRHLRLGAPSCEGFGG